MPIVNLMSNVMAQYANDVVAPDPQFANGRPFVITGEVANAADDLSGSTYLLCSLPADCLLHPDTRFDVANTGFVAIRVGTRTDVDALITQTQATEDVIDPIVFGDTLYDLPLWQVLGLAENPGGFIDLYQHAAANATGAGTMRFQIHYIFR